KRAAARGRAGRILSSEPAERSRTHARSAAIPRSPTGCRARHARPLPPPRCGAHGELLPRDGLRPRAEQHRLPALGAARARHRIAGPRPRVARYTSQGPPASHATAAAAHRPFQRPRVDLRCEGCRVRGSASAHYWPGPFRRRLLQARELVGREIAIEALRDALRKRLVTIAELSRVEDVLPSRRLRAHLEIRST